jgi:galactitol-specific phosphotransferase system IIB component
MEKDFYLDEKWLAGYFEKDWADKVIKQNNFTFEFSNFDQKLLYSDYHEKFVGFISNLVQSAGLSPNVFLEVGSSLGRTFYEICKSFPTIQSASLIEPSKNLVRVFSQIFESNQTESFPVLVGNQKLASIVFDTKAIQQVCKKIKYDLFNFSYDSTELKLSQYDLVICSNVIDQCLEPHALVKFLQTHTKKSGVLALSCTYQWNNEHQKNANGIIENINELFHSGWNHLGEINLEFKCRRCERYWQMFLSHVSVFQKI